MRRSSDSMATPGNGWRTIPEIAVTLANRSGYWYFPTRVEMCGSMARGSEQKVKLVWENHGVAPAYYRYTLRMRLSNGAGSYEQELSESDNRKWMPDEILSETYSLKVPDTLKPGTYKAGIALYDPRSGRNIELAVKDSIKADGFFTIAEVQVVA